MGAWAGAGWEALRGRRQEQGLAASRLHQELACELEPAGSARGSAVISRTGHQSLENPQAPSPPIVLAHVMASGDRLAAIGQGLHLGLACFACCWARVQVTRFLSSPWCSLFPTLESELGYEMAIEMGERQGDQVRCIPACNPEQHCLLPGPPLPLPHSSGWQPQERAESFHRCVGFVLAVEGSAFSTAAGVLLIPAFLALIFGSPYVFPLVVACSVGGPLMVWAGARMSGEFSSLQVAACGLAALGSAAAVTCLLFTGRLQWLFKFNFWIVHPT